MVRNGRGEKKNGRFKRVGSSRVRVVFFTEDARERGGRSGDCDGERGWPDSSEVEWRWQYVDVDVWRATGGQAEELGRRVIASEVPLRRAAAVAA